MKLSRILISSRLVNEFRARIVPTDQIEYRFVPDQALTQDLVDWADAFVAFNPPKGLDISRLKWIHSLGAGVDGFTHHHLSPDTLLTRTISDFGEKIGLYCLSYILRDVQLHDYFSGQQNEHVWAPRSPIRLQELTLLIFGTGVIGSKVAELFTSFGCKVYGISRSGQQTHGFTRVFSSHQFDSDEREPGHGITIDTLCPESTDDLVQLCRSVDWVISTLPLTRETENMFNKRLLSFFHQAGFINVGRGGLVDEEALVQALQEEHLRRAILDVFRSEPLSEGSVLWDAPQITITPHIAAITDAAGAVECFLHTLHQIQTGQPLSNSVDLCRGY